jgi:hypothetical protein
MNKLWSAERIFQAALKVKSIEVTQTIKINSCWVGIQFCKIKLSCANEYNTQYWLKYTKFGVLSAFWFLYDNKQEYSIE